MSQYRAYFVPGAVDPSGTVCQEPQNPECLPEDFEGEVPPGAMIKKVITLNVKFAVKPNEAVLALHVKTAEAIFKPCCVRLKIKFNFNPVFKPDGKTQHGDIGAPWEGFGVDGHYSDVAKEIAGNFELPETAAIGGLPVNGGLPVIYVNNMDGSTRGITMQTDSDNSYAGTTGVILNANFERPHPFVSRPQDSTLAHEIGHVLGFTHQETSVAEAGRLMESGSKSHEITEKFCEKLRGFADSNLGL